MRRYCRIIGLLLLVGTCALAGPALAAKRVALVIGNSAYRNTHALANPRNDATDMAAVLTELGFTVITGLDLDKPAMDRTIRDFADKLTGADVGVFFYAGHGLQVAGNNYLVPVDATLSTAAALDFEMVRLDLVHRTMERETTTNILFLDACRDNPLARNLARSFGTRSAEIGRGLAKIESGAGTLISFSTQPGNVASDGAGRNSPFTAALTRHIKASDADLSGLLIDVRNDVMTATERKQVPWDNSALTARFYFRGGAKLAAGPVVPVPAVPQPKLVVPPAAPAVLTKPAPEPRPGETFRDCPDVCPEMVVVPAGEFMMGSPAGEYGREADEGPQHKVTIRLPFAVGKYAVTFDEWDACVSAGGCKHKPGDNGWGRGKRPVIYVSWDDATKEYLPWLSRKSGKTYRLLTEAEWEYAVRAQSTTAFWWGPSISTAQANYNGAAYASGPTGGNRGQTLPVDSFEANPWGLYNVHGNVWQWVQDCYKDSYTGAPSDGSAVSSEGCRLRVLRGGSGADRPVNLRAAQRGSDRPEGRIGSLGFRLAQTLNP